jgi:hypothetical protein
MPARGLARGRGTVNQLTSETVESSPLNSGRTESHETEFQLPAEWHARADIAEKPFATWHSIEPGAGVEPWADDVSLGELNRASNDEP